MNFVRDTRMLHWLCWPFSAFPVEVEHLALERAVQLVCSEHIATSTGEMKTMTRVVGICGTAVLAFLGFTVPASAVELSGTLNFTGAVKVTEGQIDWLVPVDAGTGAIFNLPPNSGYFTDPGNGGPAID